MYELHQLWHFQYIATVCCVGWGGLLPNFSVVSACVCVCVCVFVCVYVSHTSSRMRHTVTHKPPYTKYTEQ